MEQHRYGMHADDSSIGGKLRVLKTWWNLLRMHGPAYGPCIVKLTFLQEATVLFAETGVQINMESNRYVGAAIGSIQFICDYMQQKCEGWQAELTSLVMIAKSQPQATYSAFTQGLRH